MSLKNRIVVDLKKVQYGTFYYQNQFGDVRAALPQVHTSRNKKFNSEEIAYPFFDTYPFETMLERASRLCILDIWTPILVLQFAANHHVKYTGKKALILNDAWRSFIFNK